LDEIEVAPPASPERERWRAGPDLSTRLPGILKEPDGLWIRQGIEPVFHLSNPWPRPGLAVLFIESLDIVFRRTVLKRTLRRTRAGLNREPRNVEPEQLHYILKAIIVK